MVERMERNKGGWTNMDGWTNEHTKLMDRWTHSYMGGYTGGNTDWQISLMHLLVNEKQNCAL